MYVPLQLSLSLALLLDLAKSNIIPFVNILNQKRHPLSPQGQCSMELWNLERQLHQTVEPLRLDGHWVSSQCEVLPGPVFQLRDYQFYETGSFMLRQYRYEDADCSKPEQAYVAMGKIKYVSSSWAVPGASEASVLMETLNIIPYTKRAAKALTVSLRDRCQVEKGKPFPWPWLEQYRQVLVHQLPRKNPAEGDLEPGQTDEIYCAHAVNFTISELTLLRMQEFQRKGDDFFLKQLYLGLPIWDSYENAERRPSHLQSPLRSADQIVDCAVCEKVHGANRLSPPKLSVRQQREIVHKPLQHLEGDWLSSECESHVNGMYVQRQLSFPGQGRRWSLRQRMYDDPLCRHPTYTLIADGHYKPGRATALLTHTYSIAFHVQRVKLVPESRVTVRNLKHAKGCAPSHVWRKGRTIDLTSNGGCRALGIRVPAVVQDIVKIEQTSSDSLLFTGDFASTDYSGAPQPSSFRAPLVKCDQMTVVVSLSTEDYDSKTRGHYMLWKSAADRLASCYLAICFVFIYSVFVNL